MRTPKDDNLTRIFSYAVALILILLPFHAFFTTWLGSNFGHLDLFRIWKELLLVPIGLGALWLGINNKKTWQWLKTSRLFYIILIYVLLQLILGIAAYARHNVNASALIYGLLVNTRFLIFFVICWLISANSAWLKSHWRQLLLWPALIVISFGVLQLLVLPNDFLRHVGYGSKTIVAYQAVDQKPQYARVQSTLRGPNPLGAYLVLIVAAVTLLLLKDKFGRKYWGFLLAATSIVLYFTYSRSAIIGSVLAVVMIVWQYFKNPVWRQRLIMAVAALAIIGAGSVFALRHNDYFQNTFFHTDEHSRSPLSSNQSRAAALEGGLRDILHEPLGRGPGTAGPASVRNNRGSRIAENYYLQIGQETGIIGLVLFLAINLIVGWQLWRRHDRLSLILLASLAGITLINMLSHAWGDDTLALLWWGFAGIALGSGILQTNNEQK